MSAATATTPEKTLIEVVYATEITYILAPRDNDKNMTIKIHVDHANRKGIFACTTPEHVGKHKNRKVFFIADDDCILHFSDKRVFGVIQVRLSKNGKTPLQIDDNTDGVGTDYWISVEKTTAAGETEMMGQQPLGPPRIEVP